MRAAAVLLRFATPGRLAPSAARDVPGAFDREKQLGDDLIAYIDAPIPVSPGRRRT
jgi:hypothetical protein